MRLRLLTTNNVSETGNENQRIPDTELGSRIQRAEAYLDGMACGCVTRRLGGSTVVAKRCPRCELADILVGDIR